MKIPVIVEIPDEDYCMLEGVSDSKCKYHDYYKDEDKWWCHLFQEKLFHKFEIHDVNKCKACLNACETEREKKK